MEPNPPNEIKSEPNENYASSSLAFQTGKIGSSQQSDLNHALSQGNYLLSPQSPYSSSGSSKQRWNESAEARSRRLARNAERMRERRARESELEYRKRLNRNAEANRMRRQHENEMERAMRLVKNAARQRLRRAMETTDQRSKRLTKLAERMRQYRANESLDQRRERLAEMAARARQRIARESSEERKERLRKLNQYAKKIRTTKKQLKQFSNESPLNQSQSQNIHLQSQMHLQDFQTNYSPHQSVSNSIEYYQNMFINQALRSDVSKNHNSDHLMPNVRFPQSNLEEKDSPIFQPTSCETKTKPYGTVTNTIEYYQNKFIKEKTVETPSGEESNIKQRQSQLDQINHNPHPALYGQISYINNFPSNTVVSPQSSGSSTQQTYFPMYHNGFQLGITPVSSVSSPFISANFQTQVIQTTQTSTPTCSNFNYSQQAIPNIPKTSRGRPRKSTSSQQNFPAQQKVNVPLENPITSFTKERHGQLRTESETERKLRLSKIAAHQRNIRANETPEERSIRLKKLSERAKFKREQIRQTETESEKRERLSKQAEYARLRRIKSQNIESKKKVEEKAKELYAQLHSFPIVQNHQMIQEKHLPNNQQHQLATGTNSYLVKNQGKDFAQSDDVLKILEPIIVMKTK